MEELFEKYHSGKMNSVEEEDFINKIESDLELKKEYIRFKNIYSLIHLLPQDSDNQIGIEAYQKFIRKREHHKKNRFVITLLKYAVAIVLLIGIVNVFDLYFFSTNSRSESENLNELFVPAGQRSKVTLADGTVVWLNSNSKLLYSSTFSKDRSVKLTGEAFFEVVTDVERPFRVFTDSMIIRVLGTTFNVSSYPNGSTQVALFEGSVEVVSLFDKGETFLKPDQILISEDGEIRIETIKHTNDYLWKDGIYSFENEPLYSISQKLEHYYHVKIEINNTEIRDYKYTGKFRQLDGVETILSQLQKSYFFIIEKKDDKYVLKK